MEYVAGFAGIALLVAVAYSFRKSKSSKPSGKGGAVRGDPRPTQHMH